MSTQCGTSDLQKVRNSSSLFRQKMSNARGWDMVNHVIGLIMNKAKVKNFITIQSSVKIFGYQWDISLQTEGHIGSVWVIEG